MLKLYDCTSYWLFILDIPHLRSKELRSAIRIKLSSLYPGNIDDCNIQIKKNGIKRDSYLVFVLDKNTGNEMLPLSVLFIKHLYPQKNENVLYIDKKWIDFICIENGTVKSSNVKLRNDNALINDINILCGVETNIKVYCDTEDKTILNELQNKNIQYYDNLTELKKVDAHKISLFSEKSIVTKRRRIIFSIAVLFLTILSSWLFYQHQENENERNALLRQEQEQNRNIELIRQRELVHLSTLKQQYNEIINNKTATPFEIAAVIADCTERQTRIQSATFNGNFFQIEGITAGSLGLLQNFENHHFIESVRLHQVHPIGNRDNFTLSGNVLIREPPVDEALPVNEQIKILESLIAKETEQSITSAQLSPSAFGTAVNSLFSRWGCTVTSFQFINEPRRTEIEVSLRGTGSNFFNALYEIKTRHSLWDVHLTQIRNLYPRNMLEITIRIRTEYVDSKTQFADHIESFTAYPVANISRNYFIPSTVQQPVTEQVRAQLQPPVALPTVRAERVTWLEYVGSIVDEQEGRFIYVKDTRTDIIIKLGQHIDGNMRYALNPTGGIIAYINEHIYEINRR